MTGNYYFSINLHFTKH